MIKEQMCVACGCDGITYRCPRETEAEKFWEMLFALDYETEFMMFEPGERKRNLLRLQEMIHQGESLENFLLCAVHGDEFVGFISAEREGFARNRHSAYIVTGVRKKYCGHGIGTVFFEKLEQWAKEQGMKRLELTVMCHNEIAKHLYEKNGFVVEGIKKDSLLVNDKFVDEYYMAKIR